MSLEEGFVVIVTRLPKDILCIALFFLTELNLETLAAVFPREIMVPSIFRSMSNEKIERTGVTAIGDRVRLRELCKEDEEDNSRSSFGSQSVGSPSTGRTGHVP